MNILTPECKNTIKTIPLPFKQYKAPYTYCLRHIPDFIFMTRWKPYGVNKATKSGFVRKIVLILKSVLLLVILNLHINEIL